MLTTELSLKLGERKKCSHVAFFCLNVDRGLNNTHGPGGGGGTEKGGEKTDCRRDTEKNPFQTERDSVSAETQRPGGPGASQRGCSGAPEGMEIS